MTTQVQTVSVETLSLISHKNVPVVTTELLAQLYGTATNNIKNNFANNIGRFIEGKHYFKLEGQSLREFKDWVNNIDSVQVSKNTRNLILWTERGAARHAKMLDTDQAWEVFEKLEDCYFGKEQKTQPTFDLAETLSQTLNQISNGNRKLYMSMYNGLGRCFGVGRLTDIPHTELHNALTIIYQYAVEWHRKNSPTQLSLKLNDGEWYLVVKDGVVLWDKKLKPHCNDIPTNTLQNPKLMLEHIREVVGEFVGKEALPAPNLVIDIPRENVKHNNTLMPNLHTLHTLYDGYGINGNPLVRLFATLVQAQKDGKPITVKDVSGARLVYEMTEALARQYNQALDNIKRAADNAYSSGMFLPIK